MWIKRRAYPGATIHSYELNPAIFSIWNLIDALIFDFLRPEGVESCSFSNESIQRRVAWIVLNWSIPNVVLVVADDGEAHDIRHLKQLVGVMELEGVRWALARTAQTYSLQEPKLSRSKCLTSISAFLRRPFVGR
jgi:hypothetical protein